MRFPAGLSTTLAVQWWLPGATEDEEKIAPTFELCCDAVSTCDCPVVVTGTFPPGVADAVGEGDAEAWVDADVRGEDEAEVAAVEPRGAGAAEALVEVAAEAFDAAGVWVPCGTDAQAVATPAPVPVAIRPEANIAATLRAAVSISIPFLPFRLSRLPPGPETSVGATWELDEKLGSRTATGTDTCADRIADTRGVE
jgi:hypothetical protein